MYTLGLKRAAATGYSTGINSPFSIAGGGSGENGSAPVDTSYAVKATLRVKDMKSDIRVLVRY